MFERLKLRRLSRSLSLRLIAIFLAMGALFAGGTVLGIRWVYATDQLRELVSSHLSLHVAYVRKDIGNPPRIDRAIAITKQVPVDIRIVGPGLDWASDSAFPALDDLSFAAATELGGDTELWLQEVDGLQLAISANHRFLRIDSGPYAVVVSTPKISTTLDRRQLTPVIIGFGLVLVLVAYLAVRWLFKPIQEIRHGAAEVGRGRLDHRIDTGRSDQLGDLAGDINKLADNVQGMLDAKRELLLGISHELRTPLSRLRLGLELVDNPTSVKGLKQEVREMEKIITALLEAERLNTPHAALHLVRVSIAQLLNRLIEDYFYRERQRLDIHCPDTALLVADEARVMLLLKNLISNALRYSEPEDGPVSIEVNATADGWLIAVRDQGPGIAPDQVDVIGEPFYRSDPSRTRNSGGSGLGLYLAKLIATAHHGQLWLDRSYSNGACFVVTLPKEPPSAQVEPD